MSVLTIPVSQGAIARGLSALALLMGAGLGVMATAPKAVAIEDIQLTYGALRLEAIDFADLEAFASTGETSSDIQALLNFARIDNDIARAILKAEIEIDADVFNRATNTFMFESFLRLVGSAIGLPDTPLESWRSLQNALTTSALDSRISILEVLDNLEGTSLMIDIERAIAVADTVREDFRDIQALFASLKAADPTDISADPTAPATTSQPEPPQPERPRDR